MLATIRLQPNFKLKLTSFLHARCRPGDTFSLMFGKTPCFWQFHCNLSWHISFCHPLKLLFISRSLFRYKKGHINPLNWWAGLISKKEMFMRYSPKTNFILNPLWKTDSLESWLLPRLIYRPFLSRPRSLRSLSRAGGQGKTSPGVAGEIRHLFVTRNDFFWQSAQWNERKTSLIPHKTSQTSSSNTSSRRAYAFNYYSGSVQSIKKLLTLWPFHINCK